MIPFHLNDCTQLRKLVKYLLSDGYLPDGIDTYSVNLSFWRDGESHADTQPIRTFIGSVDLGSYTYDGHIFTIDDYYALGHRERNKNIANAYFRSPASLDILAKGWGISSNRLVQIVRQAKPIGGARVKRPLKKYRKGM